MVIDKDVPRPRIAFVKLHETGHGSMPHQMPLRIVSVEITPQLPRGAAQQRLARRGCSPPQLHAAVLERETSAGDPLVRRERGVALDDCDAVQGDVELFSHDLRQRSLNARAEVDLAGIDRDLSIRCDGKKGIDAVGRDKSFRPAPQFDEAARRRQ